jgi:hypothetical protein
VTPEPSAAAAARKPTYGGSPINRGIGQSSRGPRFSGRRGLVALVAVLAVLAAFAWVGLHDNADAKRAPGAGSCVRLDGVGTHHATAHRVDCSSTDAQFTVLSKVIGGDRSACAAVSGTVGDLVVTSNDHPAYVLCLGSRADAPLSS